jgi:23S rRNA pseudouridine2605 synthase
VKKETEKRTGLARVLSKMGYCSRSQAERLVRDGRVRLNGALKHDPETPVRMGVDRVEVDDKPLKAVEKIYWMMNKPRGIVTTADDEKGRETVYDLLPKDVPWMGPVGRLDKASEGLLLLSNDTEWAARITAPENHVDKTYHVQLGGAADDALLKKFETGVTDEGELLKAKRTTLLRSGDKNFWLEVILDEGRNRQIRRMAEASGREVLRLVRVAIGGLELGDLPQGQVRPLTEAERQGLA